MMQQEAFGKKNDEERDARLERLDKKFSDNVMISQGLVGRISQLEQELSTAKKSIKDMNEIHNGFTESLTALSGIVYKCMDNVEAGKKALSSKIDSLGQSIDKNISEHEKNKAQTQTQVDFLQSQIKSLNVDSKIESAKKYLASSADEIKKHVDHIYDKLKEHGSALEGINAGIASLAFNLSDVDNNANTSSKKLTEHDGKIASIVFNLEDKISSLSKQMKSEIDKVSEKYKPQQIDHEAIASVVKDKIQKHIDNITIDSANASLKYNNISNDVSLLGKKIENIFLTLKKLDQSRTT
jgi:predicted  nucleic acid-binding Zn-ribbon protein